MTSKLEENVKKIYKQYKNTRTKTTGSTYEVIFQITDACNLRCKYCYEEDKQHSILSLKSMMNVIDKLFSEDNDTKKWWRGRFNKNNVDKVTIHFFGGECTLEILLMDRILDYFIKKCDEENSERSLLWKKNMGIVIETNATLLQTDVCKEFLKKWITPERDIFMSYSLDGIKEAHDLERRTVDDKPTFDIVYNNIMWFTKEYPIEKYPILRVNLKATLSKNAIQYFYESYLMLQKISSKIGTAINLQPATGLDTWSEDDVILMRQQLSLVIEYILNSDEPLQPIMRLTDGEDNQYDMSHFTVDKLCGSCGTVKDEQIVVSVDDKLYTCVQFSPVTLNSNKYSIGNVTDGISDKGLKIIRKIKGSYDKKSIRNENCIHCPSRYKCIGFCPAFNTKSTGDMCTKHINDAECAIWREIECARNKIAYFVEKKKWTLDII